MNHWFNKIFFTLGLIFFFSGLAQAQFLDEPSVVINLPSRTLEVYSANRLVKEYAVAIGTPGTPTPTGSYKIYFKEKNPTWYPTDGRPPVSSGPDNPLGYRWMEFAPTYGVHGTNAPWSIGNWASHGCVRMLESDVEEVFNLIPVGTPLKITYDRVKIRISDDGQAAVGIYPDVYGRQTVTIQKVKEQLAKYSFAPFISDEQIRQLVATIPDKPVVLVKAYALRVNQAMLQDAAVSTGTGQQSFYIPIQPVAQYLNTPVTFAADQKNVTTDLGKAPVVVKNNQAYVLSHEIKNIFPVQVITDKASATIQLKTQLVSLNDQIIPLRVQKTDQGLALPIQDLAHWLHKNITVSKDALAVEGKPIKAILLGGIPYLTIDQIGSYFDVFVYYNEVTSTVELNTNS